MGDPASFYVNTAAWLALMTMFDREERRLSTVLWLVCLGSAVLVAMIPHVIDLAVWGVLN